MAALWNAIASVVTNIFTAAQSLFSRLPVPQFIAPQNQRKEFSVEVVRPDDLLVVTLDFYNLHVAPTSGATPAQIARSGTGNGFVIAHFPPQSFAERAFFEAAPGSPGTEPLGASPVPSRIGGSSRLVFRISDTLLPLDFSLEEILRALAQSQQIVQSTIREPPGHRQSVETHILAGSARSLRRSKCRTGWCFRQMQQAVGSMRSRRQPTAQKNALSCGTRG